MGIPNSILKIRGTVSGGSSGSMEPLDFLKWPYGTTQFLKMVLEIMQFLIKKSCFGGFFALELLNLKS